MDPIHYGDVVGLTHPGNYVRIASKDDKLGFLQFTVQGGEKGSVVPNGGTISLSQAPVGHYSLLSSEEKWKVTFSGNGPLQHGARVRLDPIVHGSREHQLYIIHKVQEDPIEHVVLLMMENRSFFRVFGYMDPNRDTYVNKSENGKEYRSAPSDDLETPDPPHEIDFVNISLAGEKPDGYVKAYEKYHKQKGTAITDADLHDVMGYTRKGFLPALHRMADFASVCSQWYCSLRGPTWPNRMYALSGTCFGWKTTPEMNPNILHELKDFLKEWHGFKPVHPQKFSVFDILDEKKVSYNVYTDTPLEFTLSADVFYPHIHDDDMGKFKRDAKSGKLPKFSFIEPNFVHMPNFGFLQNDDHPPANPLKAQKFIADVYNTLRESPKWKNTLLCVTYDEHGGFFDPVVPPAAPVPEAASDDEAKTFGKFGVRVPTVLVSPCIKQGIDDTVYDHTSVLKYVLQKWAPEAVGHLGERVKYANTLPTLREPRTDEFPLITEEDFQPLKELRAANNKEVEPVAVPDERLPLHASAQVAIQDPEVAAKLRNIIVEKRVTKSDDGVVGADDTDLHPDVAAPVVHTEGHVAHAVHGVAAAASALIHGGIGLLSSAIHHMMLTEPTNEGHNNSAAATTAPAHPAAAPAHTPGSGGYQHMPPGRVSDAATLSATTNLRPGAKAEAERYADDIIRLIREGVDAKTLADQQKYQDLMANQIRAMSMFSEKNQGTNDLARSYLQLLQVRAKKHTKKICNTRKPSV